MNLQIKCISLKDNIVFDCFACDNEWLALQDMGADSSRRICVDIVWLTNGVYCKPLEYIISTGC